MNIDHVKSIRGYEIKKAHWHDAGAYGRCSYCSRYSDRPCCLDSRIICDCGKSGGFSGSFKPPTKDSIWSEKR